jgi:hypothetical protein
LYRIVKSGEIKKQGITRRRGLASVCTWPVVVNLIPTAASNLDLIEGPETMSMQEKRAST